MIDIEVDKLTNSYIKEPIDVDLVVAPIPLTSEDKTIISACIAAYKKKKRTPRKKTVSTVLEIL